MFYAAPGRLDRVSVPGLGAKGINMNSVTMSSAIKAGARLILHRAGGLRLWRYARRRGLRIVFYHGFPAGEERAALWKRQCAHIRKHYNPISMTKALEYLRSGEPFPPNSLVVTVDDGYRDFFLRAYPVLRAWQIPATVYVVTDFLDGKDWLWVDKVEHAILNTRLRSLELDPAPGGSARFSLESAEQRRSAVDNVWALLKTEPQRMRLQGIEKLLGQLKVALQERPPAEREPLRWDEVRKMAADGIEFGAHTLTHPILPRIEDSDELFREVQGSKAALERELQTAIVHFCYPNGDWDARTKEAVQRAGFQTAVTATPALNDPRQDPHLLNRIALAPDLPEFYFRERVAAFHI
jgi:peptidoglycan/xylan/chitin deacetylase (PgdA/CDA1 family)